MRWSTVFLFCFESRRKDCGPAGHHPHRHADGGGNGSDGLCRKQSELRLGDEVTIVVFYIRTLVDFAGVLILSVQHEQLREAALHSELAAMDNVLHRQYEQYKQSKRKHPPD